jgi:hypothetical protein
MMIANITAKASLRASVLRVAIFSFSEEADRVDCELGKGETPIEGSVPTKSRRQIQEKSVSIWW